MTSPMLRDSFDDNNTVFVAAQNGYDKAVRDLGRAKEGLDASEMETEALKTELEHFDRIRSTHEKDLKKFDKDIADTQKKIDDMKVRVCSSCCS